MKTKRWLWLFAALSVLLIAFIWGNSLRTRPQSSEQSLSLLAFMEPLLLSLGVKDPESAHGFLRKAAHFAEFGALGLSVAGFTVNLGRLRGRRYLALPMLIVLAVAVMDEYIQHFSGRASMVTDVVLDFAGALTGLAFASLLCLLINKGKTKGKEVA